MVTRKGPTDIVTVHTCTGCFVSAVPSKWKCCGKCEGGEIYCCNASLKSKLRGRNIWWWVSLQSMPKLCHMTVNSRRGLY